jgi:hypothetical protein
VKVIPLVEIELAFTVEIVIEEFTVNVLTVTVFPTIDENVILLVEMELVAIVDPDMVEYTINVLVIRLLPDILINPILTAVIVPLVLEVNVLIVDPDAVEKNRF